LDTSVPVRRFLSQVGKEVIGMNVKTNVKAGLKSERVQDGNS
jgi:hypothetical protein